MSFNNKKIMIGIGLVALILVIGAFVLLRKDGSQVKSDTEIIPTEESIPPVDSSVKVELSALNQNREVNLKIEGIPDGTESIDYELSYQTQKQDLQGIIGTLTLSENEETYEKKLTLGTCSSGTCVYHQVVGGIKLTLKFVGSYGEKIFEKEYEL
jgi:hypothetical protein